MKDNREIYEFLESIYKDLEIDYIHYIGQESENYCSDCIKDAAILSRIEYLLEQRKKPIEFRDYPFREFEWFMEWGGYENDNFQCCETCFKTLEVIILANNQHIEDAINDLNRYGLTPRLAYEIAQLIIDETNSEILINKVKEFMNWEPETEKEINHYLRVCSGIQNNTYFADSMQKGIRKNSQWTMKGSLDFVFMNQIKQINSRKHEKK